MADEIEALGTAVEGGLIARALDDEGRLVRAEGDVAGQCLNCGTPVIGHYCGHCGQALHVHRSIGAFWHDILHGVLHFEGKFWRTLPLLAWQPGELTRRYVHGERARFISPMALFLFSVFMMFAVFSYIGTPFSGEGSGAGTGQGANSFPEQVASQSRELESKIKTAEARLAASSIDPAEAEKLREDIVEYKRGRNLMASMTLSDLPYPEVGIGDADTGDTTRAGPEGLVLNSDDHFQLWDGWQDSAFGRKLMGGIKKANKNPSLLLYKLKANGYKFAWLLIPISLPFVWLTLIGRRGFRFYDHAVFTTYSISFMSLLFIGCAILAAIGVSSAIWGLILFLYPPFHMYRQLRHAYQMSRVEALIRTSFLLLFTVISLTLFFAILLALGILG
ncbi:DUF3667 domain-containing protein [Parasphingorhabdus sp.]|uniref:DUF3667 domain-containing protein n=1 Tax=Parasphingorhabdus sp. TaxID=2709688 RepID=UPI003001B5AA